MRPSLRQRSATETQCSVLPSGSGVCARAAARACAAGGLASAVAVGVGHSDSRGVAGVYMMLLCSGEECVLGVDRETKREMMYICAGVGCCKCGREWVSTYPFVVPAAQCHPDFELGEDGNLANEVVVRRGEGYHAARANEGGYHLHGGFEASRIENFRVAGVGEVHVIITFVRTWCSCMGSGWQAWD